MMTFRTLWIFCCLLLTRPALGQARYTGLVGSAAVDVSLIDYPDSTVEAVYTYTRFNTPIALKGSYKQGILRLVERNERGKATATMTVSGFAPASQTVAGTWKNLATGQQLPLTLTRVLAAEPLPEASAASRELLQVASLPNSYFKVVLTGNPDDSGSQLTAIRLLDKKTNRLVQQVPVDCQSRGLRSVATGDFNFDGYPDFSVFESSYAGPNTSSLYFLYNPATKRYKDSGFAGTSLEFDDRKKRVYEHNSCCAGTSVMNAEYKVVRNRMVLVAQHCYRWDDKKQELVERKPSACQ